MKDVLKKFIETSDVARIFLISGAEARGLNVSYSDKNARQRFGQCPARKPELLIVIAERAIMFSPVPVYIFVCLSVNKIAQN